MRLKKLGKEKQDFLNFFIYLKKRNFQGYTGLAIKNSFYQFLTAFFGKIGSLVFTIILARILMPELFGLYSLALATIVVFVAFSDLGVQQTLIRFVSKNLGKEKQGKANAYVKYLFKIKLFLVLGVSFVLVISAKFISANYYQKPLFLALLGGVLYIISINLIYVVEALFQSFNKFKYPFFKEVFFQIIRLILVPLAVLVSLKYAFSHEAMLFLIFLALSFSYFLALVFIFFLMKKKLVFLKVKKEALTTSEKSELNKFMWPLSAIALSGVFFGYVDMIMLGRFVLAEFIGYYRVAFSLIASAIYPLTFSFVLYPLFSRLKGQRLKRALTKSVKVTLLLSVCAALATLFLAPYIIGIAFGNSYVESIPLLRLFALLLLSGPLTALYTSYIISQGKPFIVAKLLIFSTLINICLNYFFITWFITYGQKWAIFGAAMATIISCYFYLFGLIFCRKN